MYITKNTPGETRGERGDWLDYIKLSRKMLEWEWYTDVNTCRLFFHMLLKANWKDGRFQGAVVPRGSFVSSISKLSIETGLTEMQVRTALKHLKTTGEVTGCQQAKFTVFTVNNYNKYQSDNKGVTDGQQLSNADITGREQASNRVITGEQQEDNTRVTTIEEKKEVKNERMEEGKKVKHMSSCTSADRTPEYQYKAVIDYLNTKMCTSYRASSKDTQKHIRARFQEGYTLDDFVKVIDKKVREWKGTEFEKFLRPSTLFGPKFENYLNQTGRTSSSDGNKFNNFQPRDYDFPDMEKALLGANMQ